MVEEIVEKAKKETEAFTFATLAFMAGVVGTLLGAIATVASINYFLVDAGILLAFICAVALVMMCINKEHGSSLKAATAISSALFVWSLSWATLYIFSPEPTNFFSIWVLGIFATLYSRKLARMLGERSREAIQEASEALGLTKED